MGVHCILNGGVPKERFQLVTYQAITAERGTIAELYHDWHTLTKLKNLVKATWPRINLWQPLFNWGKPRNIILLKYQHNLLRFYVNFAEIEVKKAHSLIQKPPFNDNYEIDIDPISKVTFRKLTQSHFWHSFVTAFR